MSLAVQEKILWLEVSVDDGEGVKILKGGHNLGCVEKGGRVRELPRAEQDHEGLTSKGTRL